jgi:NAD(P)-dependent dehydrogenase (short-subunit alcohol dehydrogenase family)
MKPNQSVSWRRIEPSRLQLEGKRVAVIGGTGGIGRALSRFMASRGAAVWVVGQTFRDEGTAGIEFLKADLSLMEEARRVGRELPAESLDLVVMTTGIFAAPTRRETAEGIELDLAVSYLSRLVILREIAPRLGTRRAEGSPKPRVFIMGFPGTGQAGSVEDLNSERSYRMMAAHMNTVAGNEALVLDSAGRYPQLNVYGLNPGIIKSNIRANVFGGGSWKHRLAERLIGWISTSAETYAERITPLLVSPDIEPHSGALFDRKGVAILPSPKLIGNYVQKIINVSETLARRGDRQLAP